LQAVLPYPYLGQALQIVLWAQLKANVDAGADAATTAAIDINAVTAEATCAETTTAVTAFAALSASGSCVFIIPAPDFDI
jgi:hypothetical protein